jgi:hypothetical protein
MLRLQGDRKDKMFITGEKRKMYIIYLAVDWKEYQISRFDLFLTRCRTIMSKTTKHPKLAQA